jgi:hypothetical protein
MAGADTDIMVCSREPAKFLLGSENIIMQIHRQIVLLHREILIPVVEGGRTRNASRQHARFDGTGGVEEPWSTGVFGYRRRGSNKGLFAQVGGIAKIAQISECGLRWPRSLSRR